MSDDIRRCGCCGKTLARKRYGRRLEDLTAFRKRRFCGKSCASTRKAEMLAQKKKDAEFDNSETALEKEDKTPLEYMLGIMNDPKAEQSRRDAMAKAAAPFCHVKNVNTGGKKQEKEAAAEKAASGNRFAPGSPPTVIQGGGRK